MGREDNIKWGENKNELGTQATAGAQEDRLKHIHLVQEAEQKKMDRSQGGAFPKRKGLQTWGGLN